MRLCTEETLRAWTRKNHEATRALDLFRVYDADPPHGGPAFLVERLWPRGLRRDQIPMDDWLKDVAPSTELRKWF